jgi:phosphatidylserine/phosphatidylglycerophosphate/cardiolipin synthase-like enzyme
VIAVLPQLPDQSSPLSRVPQELGRDQALRLIQQAGGDRVAVYGLENHAGAPVYVHAKVCVMDDCWATVGSDNFNRRSWTHDSELSAVVVDAEGGHHSAYARRLRLRLAAEHLDRSCGEDDLLEVMADCVSSAGMFRAFGEAAARLQAWHDGGATGPRPPGRLVPLHQPRLSRLTRAWAGPLYRVVHDPDGRPRALRQRAEF